MTHPARLRPAAALFLVIGLILLPHPAGAEEHRQSLSGPWRFAIDPLSRGEADAGTPTPPRVELVGPTGYIAATSSADRRASSGG